MSIKAKCYATNTAWWAPIPDSDPKNIAQPARISTTPTHMPVILYAHSSTSDLIEIDDDSARWRMVQEDAENPVYCGAMGIVHRMRQSVRGSYTVENDRRCCLYWSNDQELIFRTHDGKRLCLFKRESDGLLIHMAPYIQAHLQSATYGDGREVRGMSTFSLRDGVGHTLYEITYDSLRYCEMFGMASMLTFIPDEDLSDWDFFVGAKKAVDQLTIIARACAQLINAPPARTMGDDDVLMADTGMRCPHAGLWAPCRHDGLWHALSADEPMPDHDGIPATWVLICAER